MGAQARRTGPPGTPNSGAEALTAHVNECPKHPLATARGDLSAALGLLRECQQEPHTQAYFERVAAFLAKHGR